MRPSRRESWTGLSPLLVSGSVGSCVVDEMLLLLILLGGNRQWRWLIVASIHQNRFKREATTNFEASSQQWLSLKLKFSFFLCSKEKENREEDEG